MNDYIMAAFQLGACFFLVLSIGAVFRDRIIKGVSVWMIAFFTIWTVFGTYNWYVLNQYWSFVTSVLMGILYVIWLTIAIAAAREVGEDEFLSIKQLMDAVAEYRRRT